MSEKTKLDAAIEALAEIRRMAMEHPAFSLDAFEQRDIDALCEEGGDVCDWTMIAIHADDGLNPVVKDSFTTEKGKP